MATRKELQDRIDRMTAVLQSISRSEQARLDEVARLQRECWIRAGIIAQQEREIEEKDLLLDLYWNAIPGNRHAEISQEASKMITGIQQLINSGEQVTLPPPFKENNCATG